MIRFLPMFVTGVLCNVLVVAVVAHISVVYILGEQLRYLPLKSY